MTDLDGSDRVLILGAGTVGLGAALELARFGIPSLVIEKHPSTSWHPKTRNFNTRTMEIARGWGRIAYDRLRAIDAPEGWKSPIWFMDRANGEVLGRLDTFGFVGPGPDVSPAHPIMTSQELIEEIQLDAARATGLVEIAFNHEALRLLRGGDEADQDVALLVRDRINGTEREIAGPALVAADGAASLIRGELQLQMQGPANLSHVVNCYFRAEIEPHLNGRTGVLFFVSDPDPRGVLQPLDARGRWLCQIMVKPEDWSLERYTADRARAWIRNAAGLPDLDPEILSIGLWTMNATVADRFVSGRVIMVGDAAHQFPPTGGLGVNTGLQGMHNAMWKLAYALQGRAGWDLVRTYQDERRAAAVSVTQQSLQNSINVARIQAAAVAGGESGLSTEEVLAASRRYGNHLGVEFGVAYASSAIVPDGTCPPEVDDAYSDYAPSASPGCRAPHVWLGPTYAPVSTLDLFGPHMTLLAASGASAWIEQARALDIPAYRVGAAGLADRGDFEGVYGVDPGGAVLVRPDGYVAWRSAGAPSEPGVLKRVMGAVLGHGGH